MCNSITFHWQIYPIDRFVKRQLHGGPPEPVDVDALKHEIQELRLRNQQLEEENDLLKTQVIIIFSFLLSQLSFTQLTKYESVEHVSI